ncbi:MAG: hypothetical protein HDR92_00170 [Bacteroides sp.]|nr:hypothetical protein [Bacteroides sp.]
MNRVVLIGNGFDLAHGLPTKYEDFINWYWEQWGKKLRNSSKMVEQDVFCSFALKNTVGLKGWYLVHSHVYKLLPSTEYDYIKLVNTIKNDKNICDFKCTSILFLRICNSIETKGWVDIEYEYYDLLCNYIKDSENCKFTLFELNNHLHFLRSLLIEYLTFLKTSHPQFTNPTVAEKIYSPITKDDICISQSSVFWNYVDSVLQHEDEYRDLLSQYCFTPRFIDDIIDYINIFKKHYEGPAEYNGYSLNSIFYPKQILLLNFNYTTVADNYKKRVSIINHIHGIQYSPETIIFGYGDELDDDYKALLNQTDTESLKNIKSIKYLESSNYRKLLQFIESEPYQIYIMGHSCGNSDRTLLNTLFEHKNCVSIKPFYYQKRDGSDNYMEIVQNICRNFTDMKLMRDYVVNKTYCEPLPQVSK